MLSCELRFFFLETPHIIRCCPNPFLASPPDVPILGMDLGSNVGYTSGNSGYYIWGRHVPFARTSLNAKWASMKLRCLHHPIGLRGTGQ